MGPLGQGSSRSAQRVDEGHDTPIRRKIAAALPVAESRASSEVCRTNRLLMHFGLADVGPEAPIGCKSLGVVL
jgi:hypothetical protein